MAGVDHSIAKAADPSFPFRHVFSSLFRALKLWLIVIGKDVVIHDVFSSSFFNFALPCPKRILLSLQPHHTLAWTTWSTRVVRKVTVPVGGATRRNHHANRVGWIRTI